MVNINELHSQFKLPISYNKDSKETPIEVTKDLELCEFVEDDKNCMYDHIFTPKSLFGKELLQQWSKYYTSDVNFLKDNQKLVKNLNITDSVSPELSEDIWNQWKEIKNNTSFKENYQYIEWEYLESFNRSPLFLEFLSLYTLTSPVLSLLSPVLLLIVPFFILKLQNQNVTVKTYFSHLMKLLNQIPLGRMFNIHNLSWEKRVYAIISFIFYLLQIYQNIQFCFKFKTNMVYIHEFIEKLKLYTTTTIKSISQFIDTSSSYKTFTEFNHSLEQNKLTLIDFNAELNKVTPYQNNLKKLPNIGYVMKIFYEIYSNIDYHKTLLYSFGFNGFLDNINTLKDNITNKHVNKCKFSKNKITITDGYYCCLKDNNPIKNTYNIDKNMLITGPNAAGKTTLLKSTLFNLLLSQQIGFGCYKKATINPFHYFHCYINIPDTSGRDSLFQAEARRCREILNSLESNNDKRHFCIFDELYSGTNPYEAISSAYAYLLFLNKNSNINFILTTHYIQLCEKIELLHSTTILNKHMDVIPDENDFNYTYKLVDGISNIKGGIKVLKDLDYPIEIINTTQKIILTL